MSLGKRKIFLDITFAVSASNKQDEVRFERDAHNSQEIMAVSQSQPMRRCDRAVSDGQPLPFQVQIHYTDLSGTHVSNVATNLHILLITHILS